MIDIESALEKLFSMRQMGVKLGLDNIRKLLNYLDNPQNNLKSFHIAGSNGKGSTASFIASILKESGHKTGLFTSPHFVKFNERIRIDGEMIPDEYIAMFIEQLSDYIEENEPTFFELSAALAFKYFKDQKVDYAIIETGLGGRLDATNTIDPIASVITTISLEHTRILGDTIEKIAEEKGGIIKRNGKTVLGLIPGSAKQRLSDIAKERVSEIIPLESHLDIHENYSILSFGKNQYNLYNLGLQGKHQFQNAALALLTLVATIGDKVISEWDLGLVRVVENTGIQGRFEIYNKSPLVIFDAAHNLEGLEVFENTFKKVAKTKKRKIAIFGAMRDKNLGKMILSIDNIFDEIYFTTIDFYRATKVEDLISIAKKNGINAKEIKNPTQFIRQFIQKGSESCLVLIGSIYIIGEIKEKLQKLA